MPGKTYPPYSARFLEFVEGGGFIDRAPSGVYRGTWREDERGVVVQHPVHGPQSYRLLDGALLRWTEDEEHGGFHVLSYMPDVPPQLDAVTALLKKSKAPAELIEKRGWLLRALFEGRLDLLALVLRATVSLSRTFQAAALLGLLGVAGFYAALGDPAIWWLNVLSRWEQELAALAAMGQAADRAMLEQLLTLLKEWAPFLPGQAVSAALLLALLAKRPEGDVDRLTDAEPGAGADGKPLPFDAERRA